MNIRRQKVEKIGINDAPYNVVTREGGKTLWKCPYYSKWVNMLHRVTSETYHKRQPTYKDCKVCEDWIYFTNFRKWCVGQEKLRGKRVSELQLDKDLLEQNNKEYSPDKCLLVLRKVNNFIEDRKARRGVFKIGVSWCKATNKFKSSCKNPVTEKRVTLGRFNSEDAAHEAWKNYKILMVQALWEGGWFLGDTELRDLLIDRYENYKSD